MPTPTRKKISASTETVVSRKEVRFLCHNNSTESLDLWRFSDDFLPSTVSRDSQESPESTLTPPGVDAKKSAPRNDSPGYNDNIDEDEHSSELASDMSFSARRIRNDAATRQDIVAESSPNFSEDCGTRESILIIKEVITLDSSSDDEIESSGDMEKGAAAEPLEKTEYEKYLQLKKKYEGKRKPEFYSKFRAPK